MQSRYKTELAEKLFKIINQVAILNITRYDKEERKRLISIEKDLQERFNKIDNKKEYLQKLANRKKDISEQIKTIDNIISAKPVFEEIKIEIGEHYSYSAKQDRSKVTFFVKTVEEKIKLEKRVSRFMKASLNKLMSF